MRDVFFFLMIRILTSVDFDELFYTALIKKAGVPTVRNDTNVPTDPNVPTGPNVPNVPHVPNVIGGSPRRAILWCHT